MTINFGKHILAIDTETGGLSSYSDPILEIAAELLDPVTLEPIRAFHSYVGPEEGQTVEQLLASCNKIALSVNGFNNPTHNVKLNDAPPIKDVLKRFMTWLGKSNYIVFGQNPGFDIDFINGAFKRCNLDYKLNRTKLDLQSLTILYYAILDGAVFPADYRLQTIAAKLGFQEGTYHTAIGDVKASVHCLKHIVGALQLP